MIDLVGYRRFGHNEGDEPSYTQPVMYDKIREHPSVCQIWAKTLKERGVIEADQAEQMVEDIRSRMEEVQKNPPEMDENDDDLPEGRTEIVEVPEIGPSRAGR